MKQTIYILLAIIVSACEGCSATAPTATPQVVNTTTNNTTNYGDAEPPCIMRGDFTYCRTCYQYDGMKRQACYWSRPQ